MKYKKTEKEKHSATSTDGAMPVIFEEDTTYHAADRAGLMKEGNPDDVDDEDEEDCYKFELKGSICNINFDITDLSAIINGYLGNQIELRPFNNTVTWQNIWKWLCKVGFIPMNRNALYDEKVRQQLGGNKAAIGEQGYHIMMLVSNYEKNAKLVTDMGFN